MQPNFEAIRKRIDNMPLSSDLKSDLFDGIETCQQFSVMQFFLLFFYINAFYHPLMIGATIISLQSCVPDKMYGNIPAIKELIRPTTFFKCFKGKKIEACMKKDLREKFGSLLTGVTSNIRSQLKAFESEMEGMDRAQSIFNMVYGFDMDNGDGFF